MRVFRPLAVHAIAVLLACSAIVVGQTSGQTPHREVAITIDDLPWVGDPQAPPLGAVQAMQSGTRRLLAALVSNNAPAIGFVNEKRLYVKGEIDWHTNLLRMWLDRGMTLGNHTFSHVDLNTAPVQYYEDEIVRGAILTRMLMDEKKLPLRYFRYPYNHTGASGEDKSAIETFLASHDYQIAPFTVEHEDYIFNQAYLKAKHGEDKALPERIRAAYLDFLDTMFDYFERVSRENMGYEVKQILLIHANEINAESLNEMLQRLRRRGYSFITLEQALKDKAYRTKDDYVGKFGISWLHRWTVSLGRKMSNHDEPDPPKFVLEMSREK